MNIFIPIGNPAIADSSDANRIVSPVPTEPVFSDERGEICRSFIGQFGSNMLLTKAGHMRSGDFHPTTQLDFVMSGRAILRTWEAGAEIRRVLAPNTFVSIGAFVPHLFEFLEDTVMLEWWDGPFSCWYWKPYRDVITKNMESLKKAAFQ